MMIRDAAALVLKVLQRPERSTASEVDDDLVQALRDHSAASDVVGGYPIDKPTTASRAADRIEELKTELARLREYYEARESDDIIIALWSLVLAARDGKDIRPLLQETDK